MIPALEVLACLTMLGMAALGATVAARVGVGGLLGSSARWCLPWRERTFEQRELTVVFADLSGFSEFAEIHGDQRAAAVARDLERRIGGLLKRHRGRVVKRLGDGAMIICRDAAEAIRLATRLAADRGGELPVHLGVHTGPAVRSGCDWYGTTVNVAARIAAEANAGEVLVSERTYAAAGSLGDVWMREVGPLVLRNIARPVVVHRASLDSGHAPRAAGLLVAAAP